ncbi:MAG: hypothetical protein LBD14_01030, partial [Puniceicoccales bacterium]|nr:hypothetical protein [Puniceicoccales bacterium]
MTHQKNTAQTGFVKKLLAHAAMALCAIAAPAANANAADTPDSDSPGKRHSLETGLLIYTSDVTSVGVNFHYAYALGETNRLTFDLGACFDVDPKVTGHFSYHYSGSSIIHHDGKIQVNHTIVPILIGWEYEWCCVPGDWAWIFGGRVRVFGQTNHSWFARVFCCGGLIEGVDGCI